MDGITVIPDDEAHIDPGDILEDPARQEISQTSLEIFQLLAQCEGGKEVFGNIHEGNFIYDNASLAGSSSELSDIFQDSAISIANADTGHKLDDMVIKSIETSKQSPKKRLNAKNNNHCARKRYVRKTKYCQPEHDNSKKDIPKRKHLKDKISDEKSLRQRGNLDKSSGCFTAIKGQDKVLYCKLCGRPFNNALSLQIHLTTHRQKVRLVKRDQTSKCDIRLKLENVTNFDPTFSKPQDVGNVTGGKTAVSRSNEEESSSQKGVKVKVASNVRNKKSESQCLENVCTKPSSNINSTISATDSGVGNGSLTVTGMKPMEHCRSATLSNKSVENCRVTVVKPKPDSVLSRRITPSDTNTLKQTSGTKNIKVKRGKLVCKENTKINSKSNDTASRVVGQKSEHNRNASIIKRNQHGRVRKTKTQVRNGGENGTSDKYGSDGGNIFLEKSSSLMNVLDPLRSKRDVDLEMVSNSTDCFAIQDENPENVSTIDRNPETNGGLLSFDFEEVSKKVTARTQKHVNVGLRPTECLDSVRNDCLMVRNKCDESVSLSDNMNIDRKESFNRKVRIKRGRLVRGTPLQTCNRNEQIENDRVKCDPGKLLHEINVSVVSDVSENRVGNAYDKNSDNMKVTDGDRRETVISETEQSTILKSKSRDCRTSADKRDSDIDMNPVGTDKTQQSVSQIPYCIDRSKNLGRMLKKCENTETEEQKTREMDCAKSSSPCDEKKTGNGNKNRVEIVEDKRFINEFCSCDDINISGLHSERCNSVTEVRHCTDKVMESTVDVYYHVGFESEKGQNSDDQGNLSEGMHANAPIHSKYDSSIEEHDQCDILLESESDCAFSDDDFDEHVPLILHRHTSRTLPMYDAIRSLQYQSNQEEELRNYFQRNTESSEAEKTEISSEVITKLHTLTRNPVPDFSVGQNTLSKTLEQQSRSDSHSQQNSTNVDIYNNEEQISSSKFSNDIDIYIDENHTDEDLVRSKTFSKCNKSALKDAQLSPLETNSLEEPCVTSICSSQSQYDASQWNTSNGLESTGLKDNVKSTSGKQDSMECDYMSSHLIADKSVNATVDAVGSVGRGKGDVNVSETSDVFVNVEADRKDDLLSNTLSESELEPDTVGYRNDMMSTCNVEGAFVEDIVGAVGIIPALENSSSCSNPMRYMIHDYCARQISYQNFIQSKLEDYEYLNASLKEDSCARINTYHSYVLDKLKTSQAILINDSVNEDIGQSSDASQDCYNIVSRQMLSSSDVQMKLRSQNFTGEDSYSRSGDLRPPAGEGERPNTERNDQSLSATEGDKNYTTETCVIDNSSTDIQNMCLHGSNAEYSDKQTCDDERSLVGIGKLGTEVSSPKPSEELVPSSSMPDNIQHIQIDKETAEKGVAISLDLEESMEHAKIECRNASLSDDSEFSVSVDSVSDSCARVRPFEVNIIHKFSEETKNILMEYQSRHQNRATLVCDEDSTPEKSGVGVNIDSHTQTLSSLDENECIVYESHMIGSVSSVSTASKNSMVEIGFSNPSHNERKCFNFEDTGLVKDTKTSASVKQQMPESIHGGGLIPFECDTSRYSLASAEGDMSTNRNSNDSVMDKQNILISDDEYRFVKSPKKQWYMAYIDTQSEGGREDLLTRKVVDNVEITSQEKQLSSLESGNIDTLRRNVDFGSARKHESNLEMCDSVSENESVEMSSLKHHLVVSDGSTENFDTEIVKSALNTELGNDDQISVGDDLSNVFRDVQTIDFVSRQEGIDSDSDTSMADGSCSRSRKFIKRRSCARAKSYVLGCARSRTFVLTLNN